MHSISAIASRSYRFTLCLVGVLAAFTCNAQMINRPTIGLKIGFSFADTHAPTGDAKSIEAYWLVGADFDLSVNPLFGGRPRGDVDLSYGPGNSSQFRVGISQVWYGPALGMRPYLGFGVGFLFEDKRRESDRTVLSGKLFGGLEFGKNSFVEAGILQSSRVDALQFSVGVRF